MIGEICYNRCTILPTLIHLDKESDFADFAQLTFSRPNGQANLLKQLGFKSGITLSRFNPLIDTINSLESIPIPCWVNFGDLGSLS